MKTMYNSKYVTFKKFGEVERCIIEIYDFSSYKIEEIVSELTNNSLYSDVRLSNKANKNYKLIDPNKL